MERLQATILDGTDSKNPFGSKVKDRIIEAYESAGYTMIVHRMEELRIAHCIGWFGCWR